MEWPEISGQVVDRESGDDHAHHRRRVDVTKRTVPACTLGVHNDRSTGPDRNQREDHMYGTECVHEAMSIMYRRERRDPQRKDTFHYLNGRHWGRPFLYGYAQERTGP